MDRTSARARLEEALISPDLCSEDRVRLLVTRAFSPQSDGKGPDVDDQVLDSRFQEVWKFLSELRGVSSELAKESAVVDDIEGRGWKVKEDTGNMRVLYRKGPEGTPLHTLCLEGMINGPLATALSVAWEAPYFKDWWPQFTVPTFKISESKWIEQPKPGQVIASVRFKVPWPFTAREIVLEAYAVDYLVKDVLIVLMKTLAPGPSPLSKDGPVIPPEDKGVTRMEVVGGYIFQQIAPLQCYFRTIADIDLKLALVPAWVINFISRQLAGLGLKLFEKVVQDVTSAKDTKFVKVFQSLLETDPFLQQVKTGLAAPKTFAKQDSHPSIENGSSQIPLSVDRRTIFSNGIRVTELPKSRQVEASFQHDVVGNSENEGAVEPPSVGVAFANKVEVRHESKALELYIGRESGWKNLEDGSLGKEELGASSSTWVGASGSDGISVDLKGSQDSSSLRIGDQGMSVAGPSKRGGLGSNCQTRRSVEVVDKAIAFFQARKGDAARSRSQAGTTIRRIGTERITEESPGVESALGILDKALQLLRTSGS